MAKTLLPGNDRVAVAFLKSYLGLESIASTLPTDATRWQATGFIQAQTVGGSPDRSVPRAEPVVRVDAWANSGQSNKTPWGRAEALAEAVRRAVIEFPTEAYGQTLDLGADFRNVRVLSVWPISEPRRVENDPSGYARFTSDFALSWVIA
jgi:hypothetical protein